MAQKKGEKEEKEERKSSGWRERRSREKQFLSWIADFSHCSSLSYPERVQAQSLSLCPGLWSSRHPLSVLVFALKHPPQTGGRRLIWLT